MQCLQFSHRMSLQQPGVSPLQLHQPIPCQSGYDKISDKRDYLVDSEV